MRINGIDLHVEPPAGEGELLVLVHGGWTDHNTWAALVGPLARSFRVVAYDRRGHSLSERGPGPSPRRQDEDDLAALVESMGAGPAHLVGTSYAASIALALAGRRPDLVRTVVAHEPALQALVPLPAIDALFGSVQDEIAAGDVASGTRRFLEEVVLGPRRLGPRPGARTPHRDRERPDVRRPARGPRLGDARRRRGRTLPGPGADHARRRGPGLAAARRSQRRLPDRPRLQADPRRRPHAAPHASGGARRGRRGTHRGRRAAASRLSRRSAAAHRAAARAGSGSTSSRGRARSSQPGIHQ